MKKEYKPTEELIEILKSKNLIIENEEKAQYVLNTEGYYTVINGYKDTFYDNKAKKYVNNATFEDIYTLYSFDKAFRHSLLNILLDTEEMLKTVIATEFAKEYGAIGYLNYKNFNNIKPYNITDAIKLTENFSKKIENLYADNNKRFEDVKHFINAYGYIPIWVLFNHLYFSEVRDFYKNCTPQLKIKISKKIKELYGKDISTQDLAIFLTNLTAIRNLCAHNQRLYNCNTICELSPKNVVYKKVLQLIGKNATKNSLISIATILYQLNTAQRFEKFIEEFNPELKKIIASKKECLETIKTKTDNNLLDFIDTITQLDEQRI